MTEGCSGWPVTKDEEILRAELAEHGFSDWKPFSILFVAEHKIKELGSVELPKEHNEVYFFPKQRYCRYIAEELDLESVVSWDTNEIFSMILSILSCVLSLTHPLITSTAVGEAKSSSRTSAS